MPRLNICLETTLKSSELRASTARTLDVCKKGCLLDSPVPLRPGEKVTLDIRFECASIGPIEARVLRCQSAFMGLRHALAIEFDEPNQELMNSASLLSHLREGESSGWYLWIEHREESIS